MHKRVRFQPLRIMILLTLGLLTTVAISWCLALMDISDRRDFVSYTWSGSRPAAITQPHRVADVVTVRVHQSRGRCFIRTRAQGGVSGIKINALPRKYQWVDSPPLHLIPACCQQEAMPWCFGTPWPGRSTTDGRIVTASGWPLLALSSRSRSLSAQRLQGDIGIVLSRQRAIAGYERVKCVLPLRPIWLGLIVNSLLFAAAWWPVLWVIDRLRARHRRYQCRCASCGYSRIGIPSALPCPECGEKARVPKYAHTPCTRIPA